MTAAGESVLFLQLPLPLTAGINLVEETRVMFGNYFVSSFINQVSAEWLSPGELCKGHEGFAQLLGGKKWGKRRQLSLFPGEQKKEEASTLKSVGFFFLLQFKTISCTLFFLP